MILFDSDHISVLKYTGSASYAALLQRMRFSADQDFATTIVNVEEQLRGWLASIHGVSDFEKQVLHYEDLTWWVNFCKVWKIIAFDVRAARIAKDLRSSRIRIGTMDLKIAAIALIHDARLLSANLRDFRKVPGLRVESWIE